MGNLCYVGSFSSQQPSNKASPQRARPSHALLHYTSHSRLYTYTPRPGTPIRTMYFLLPFPFPLIFSSSSIAFLMFCLRPCFILPSIPVAPQCTSMDGPRGIEAHHHPIATWYVGLKNDRPRPPEFRWGSASKWSVLRPPPPGPPKFAMSNFSQA